LVLTPVEADTLRTNGIPVPPDNSMRFSAHDLANFMASAATYLPPKHPIYASLTVARDRINAIEHAFNPGLPVPPPVREDTFFGKF
jgi:hypothetical protein